MTYKYTPHPVTEQSDVEIRLSCINFTCRVHPLTGEDPEVDDVLVLSKRRGRFVEPSDRLLEAMDKAGCFDRMIESAQLQWAGAAQDGYDDWGERRRDQKMDRALGVTS